MTIAPHVRKCMLIVHVTTSVGWIGAVIAYLALVAAAFTHQNDQTLRAAWIAMDVTGWFAIVPLSLVALLTGIIVSLGTKWGLFRHYWVMFSLVLTLVATVVLLLHMRTVSFFADIATGPPGINMQLLRDGLQGELFHAGGGMLVLIAIQTLNVYKPRGMTSYGLRKQREQRGVARSADDAIEVPTPDSLLR